MRNHNGHESFSTKMEKLRIVIRQTILMLKSSEEKQKNRKEELTIVYRTIRKNPISNSLEKNNFATNIKKILVQLRFIDEQNKRTALHTTLKKIHEEEFVHSKNKGKPTTTPLSERSTTPSPFLNFDVQNRITVEYHLESRTDKSNDLTLTVPTTTVVEGLGQKLQVIFEHDLFSTKIQKFTVIRVGVG